jgi:hypothetical protein
MSIERSPMGMRDCLRILLHWNCRKHVFASQPSALGTVVVERDVERSIPFPGLVGQPRVEQRSLESDAVVVPQSDPWKHSRNFLTAK